MKVCIVGGLGYIGQALINQYKKISAYKCDITIIDKDFNPARIEGLGCNVIIADIIKEKIDFSEYDIVYNLAGITLTYSTDIEKVDEVNRKAAIEIAKTSKRYVFASTNNVFGGRTEQGLNLTEEDEVCPKGPYATSKAAVEKWLKENHSNYIICRFGSNFGHSKSLKYAPVGNVFLLNSIFDKPLTIKGDGMNIRPMVHVDDSARALYFLAHHRANNEIFQVASRVKYLKELAEDIKKLNPNTKIKYDIDNPDWFVGYQINTDKLQNLGFEYKYNLEDAYNKLKEKFEYVKNL